MSFPCFCALPFEEGLLGTAGAGTGTSSKQKYETRMRLSGARASQPSQPFLGKGAQTPLTPRH
eukprot:1370955-Amphidinium_carterae.1